MANILTLNLSTLVGVSSVSGPDWANTANATSENGSYASASYAGISGYSDYLILSGTISSVQIPDNAVINSILAQVKIAQFNTVNGISAYQAKLWDGSALRSVGKNGSITWSKTALTWQDVDIADLWLESSYWASPAHIRTLGLGFSAGSWTGVNGGAIAYIDCARLIIDWSPGTSRRRPGIMFSGHCY